MKKLPREFRKQELQKVRIESSSHSYARIEKKVEKNKTVKKREKEKERSIKNKGNIKIQRN